MVEEFGTENKQETKKEDSISQDDKNDQQGNFVGKLTLCF